MGLPEARQSALDLSEKLGTAAREYERTDREIAARINRAIFAPDGEIHAAGFTISPRPTGPIVWCLQPGGTSGKFRCSVLHPNGSVEVYWSLTDDSGGSLP